MKNKRKNGWVDASILPKLDKAGYSDDLLLCVRETESCFDGNRIGYFQTVGYYVEGKWYTAYIGGSQPIKKRNSEDFQYEVVAWMPLPEPYKGAQGNEVDSTF